MFTEVVHNNLVSQLRGGAREKATATQDVCLSVPKAEPRFPGPVALRVEGLRKWYGAKEAVAGVSFTVREGEVFGLLGPNGAGKTTTIAMLATQRRPSPAESTPSRHLLTTEPPAYRRL